MNECIKFVKLMNGMSVNLNRIKTIVIVFILGGILDLNAQAVKLVGGLSNPTDMAIDGNTMYISDYQTGRIYKLKLGLANPVLTQVASGFGGPFGLAIKGNELYVAEYDSSQISKIDIKQSKPIKQKVLEAQGVSDLEFIGDTLFAVNFDFNRIEYALNPNLNPILNTYTEINGPFRLLVKDSLLFVNESSNGKVSKINRFSKNPLAQTFPYSFSSPAGMAEYKGILYVAENTSNTISSINLADLSQAKKTIATNIDGPDVLLVHEGILYISEFDKGQISTLSLDMANQSRPHSKPLTLYPNPCKNELFLLGIAKSFQVSIFSAMGQLVLQKQQRAGQSINTSELVAGIYAIRINKAAVQVFIKE